jgi:uncharacterized protein
MMEGRAGREAAPYCSASTRKRDDSTAIRAQVGLFARLPVAGEAKTRLVPPLTARQAAALSIAFFEDVAAMLESLPDLERTLFVSGSAEGQEALAAFERPGWSKVAQVEGDLGSRMSAAFAALLAHGAPALLVGSDHPDLPAGCVSEALDSLTRSDVALGPTADGGYYLLGVRAPVGRLLEGIAWSTSRAAGETEARFAAIGRTVARLSPWHDVDTWEDARALFRRLGGAPGAASHTRRFFETEGIRF